MSEDLTVCPTVRFPTLTADGLTPDGDGILWTVTQLDGWWDTTAVRIAASEVQPVGELITVARENARAIVLGLVASNPLPGIPLGGVLCMTAIDTLHAAIRAVYVPKLMEVIDPVNDYHALVKLVGPIKSAILGESVAVRFQVPLLAEDPLRYDALNVGHD